MKKRLFIFLFFVILFPKVVYAEDFTVSLECPDVVNKGESYTCNITTNSEVNNLNFSASAEGLNITTNLSEKKINFTIPSEAQSEASYTINITGITGNESDTAQDVSKSIRVASDKTQISNVSASDITLVYDVGSKTYEGITGKGTILISCNPPQNGKIISGTGEKTVNFGVNTYEIVSESESKIQDKYYIKITRNDSRSSNNYLSSLLISNTSINFQKTKTEYNLYTDSGEVNISATKEDSNSTVIGDTGKKSLKYGLNSFEIKVIAENTDTKVYKINITRNDVRSTNNYLKSVTLSSGTINFNKTTNFYTVNVDKNIDKLKITAALDDSKAKYVSGYGPREVTLSPGNNTVYIKVENEKNEQRTYTFNINRDDGRDSEAMLKSLDVNLGEINFKPDKLNYTLSVEYKKQKIKIDAKAKSDKAKVTIVGDTNLKVGKNVFKINVQAENGAKVTYTLTVTRKKEGESLSSNNYIKSLKVDGKDIAFKKTVNNYTVETTKDRLDISLKLDSNSSSYQTIGNSNLKNNSEVRIRVTAENGDTRDYVLLVKKTSNVFIIAIIILVTIITAGLIYLVINNIKKKRKNSKIVENNKTDDDFIETLN